MEQTDLPLYPSLSRTNSEISDVSSVPSEAGGSTSSQASEQSDRVPTQEDLDNDNWRYLSDFFVMTQTPTETRNRNCTYKCILCLPANREVKASKTTYDALKNHIKNHHPAKEAEFKALIGKNINHNKRRRDSAEIVSSPSSKQQILTNFRGLQWGKPGKPVSNKQLDDDLVDMFVDGMLPLRVSSVFSQCSVPSPPPRAILFLGVYELCELIS
jgi:hypothetical protein